MKLKKISLKELIRPIEDPSKNYPFSPKSTNPYSRIPLDNRVSYGAQNPLYNSTINYKKAPEYSSLKQFQNSYSNIKKNYRLAA